MVIEQISYLLEQLIQKKLEHQMSALIEDNNRILEDIKQAIEKKDKDGRVI